MNLSILKFLHQSCTTWLCRVIICEAENDNAACTFNLSTFWVHTVWHHLYTERKDSYSDLDKTLPTRFKHLKTLVVTVICIICRFPAVMLGRKAQSKGPVNVQVKINMRNKENDPVHSFVLKLATSNLACM